MKMRLSKYLSNQKNAIIKQFKYLFSVDDIELEITDEALRAIARKTVERKTGARGLRSIVEDMMTEIMFDIPSDENIAKVIIKEDTVKDKQLPEVVRLPENEKRLALKPKKTKKKKGMETA